MNCQTMVFSNRGPWRTSTEARSSKFVMVTTHHSLHTVPSNAAKNFVADQGERQDAVCQTGAGDMAGHAPDHRGSFILSQNLTARLIDGFAAS